jgi:IS5 family transposase
VAKREEVRDIQANWHVAMRTGKRRALDQSSPLGAVLEKLEHLKASIRAKVEHPFRIIKRQFGFVKVRYRGLTNGRIKPGLEGLSPVAYRLRSTT